MGNVAVDKVNSLTSNSSVGNVFLWIGNHIWLAWLVLLGMVLTGWMDLKPAVILALLSAALTGGMKLGAVWAWIKRHVFRRG